jgi:hypothetical protein
VLTLQNQQIPMSDLKRLASAVQLRPWLPCFQMCDGFFFLICIRKSPLPFQSCCRINAATFAAVESIGRWYKGKVYLCVRYEVPRAAHQGLAHPLLLSASPLSVRIHQTL